jgi:phage gp29-like protein
MEPSPWTPDEILAGTGLWGMPFRYGELSSSATTLENTALMEGVIEGGKNADTATAMNAAVREYSIKS